MENKLFPTESSEKNETYIATKRRYGQIQGEIIQRRGQSSDNGSKFGVQQAHRCLQSGQNENRASRFLCTTGPRQPGLQDDIIRVFLATDVVIIDNPLLPGMRFPSPQNIQSDMSLILLNKIMKV